MTYIAQADILDQGWVDLRLGQCLLQQRVYDVVQLGILESTLARLGQGCAKGQRNYNIVGVLVSTARFLSKGCTATSGLPRTYMALTPLEPGFRWPKSELRRSAAIFNEDAGSTNCIRQIEMPFWCH